MKPTSGWAYRRDVQPLEGTSAAALLSHSMIGGLVGALLLLFTPQKAFEVIVPWLLLLATITLATGKRANRLLQNVGASFSGGSLYAAQFVLGIYGGYFGGAVGLMMLAVWKEACLGLRGGPCARTIASNNALQA